MTTAPGCGTPYCTGTHVALRVVRDSVLREALESFDQALRSPAWPRGWTGDAAPALPDRATQDAVAAVAWVRTMTGLPETYVIEAAGIAERSYHEWKGKGRRPRLSSQGQLWAVVQAVEDLAADLGGAQALQRWLVTGEDGSRIGLFRQGRLDELRAASAPAPPALTGRSPAGVFALGAEPDVTAAPMPPGGVPRRPSRGNPSRRGNRATAGPADR